MQMAGRYFCQTLAEMSQDEERYSRTLQELNKMYPKGGTDGKEYEVE